MSRKRKKKNVGAAAAQKIEHRPSGNSPLMMLDRYMNQMARLGFGQNNLLEQSEYPLDRLTQNMSLLTALYRNDWIAKKVIDLPAEDMCKNWYTIRTKISPDVIDEYWRTERQTHVKERILEALKWGRLYGGAACVIMIDGHDDILDQPLNLDMVMPGSFKGLIVLDRWNGLSPGLELEEDLDDPEFGLPKYYDAALHATQSNHIRIHHSRIIRMTGRSLPIMEQRAEGYWGASELEHIFEELNKRNSTSANIAYLVFMANLRVFKLEDADGVLATANEEGQRQLYNTLEAQNALMSNSALQVIGSKDDFVSHQYTFSGLSDVYDLFMLDIAGSAEIPATKLYGRAPQGMDASGEGDLVNYYDSIAQKQEAYLRPALEKLMPIMAMSAWGTVPDDIEIEFNPIRIPTNQERADLAQRTIPGIAQLVSTGVMPPDLALKELRKASDMLGMFTEITDEDIEAAGDDAFPMGEGQPQGGYPGFGMDAEWKESDHPRKENGQFGSGGGGSKSTETERNRAIQKFGKPLKLQRNGDTIKARGVKIKIGVQDEGTIAGNILNTESFAGYGSNKILDIRDFLSDNFGGEPNHWAHLKGVATVTFEGENSKADVHWFANEKDRIGHNGFKVKDWLK